MSGARRPGGVTRSVDRQFGEPSALSEPLIFASTKTWPVALKAEKLACAWEPTPHRTPQFQPLSVIRHIRTSTGWPQPVMILADVLPLNVSFSLVSAAVTERFASVSVDAFPSPWRLWKSART